MAGMDVGRPGAMRLIPGGSVRQALGFAGLVAAGWAGFAASVQAETRGFVFSMVHLATWGEEKAGDGSVCPKGGNGGTPENRVRELIGKGYSKPEAEQLLTQLGDRGGRPSNGTLTDAKGNKVTVEYAT